ncbi:hypothetical protein SmphiM12_466 [Sinorhizobium phage phiM12]|uniref:Uncharacterized protein n=1 Tax=Sinorhizobium phage phiM12 TaxID=1357423 RepID=S5MBU7_9CAUD|nr:hypothetical protein AB690_gp153 [Sinorhizobium phage phiM12]AGR48098.1 hypothetical protein SmphiM12_466 [Sinorhizobium phage phiM12]
MKVFEHLNSFEAVAIDGGFLAAFPPGTYEIPGITERFTVTNYNGAQFRLDMVEGIQRVTTTPPNHIGFADADGNRVGSLAHFKELSAELNAMYDSSDPVNIDREYQIKKQLLEYQNATKVMSDPETIRTPVEFKIVGELADTGSDYIQSSFSLGSVGYGSAGPYKLNASGAAASEFNKLMASYPGKLKNSNHSNIRYAEATGSSSGYIFSTMDETMYPWIKDTGRVYVFKTLKEAQTHEAVIRKFVRTLVKAKVEPITTEDFGPVLVNEILTAVSSIHSQVASISPMKNSSSAKSTAMSQINKLKEKIRNAIEP